METEWLFAIFPSIGRSFIDSSPFIFKVLLGASILSFVSFAINVASFLTTGEDSADSVDFCATVAGDSSSVAASVNLSDHISDSVSLTILRIQLKSVHF